jgi:glycosyltransferase involved in cell wall biosynthesis
MKISGLMTTFEEDLFIKTSVLSVIDYLDELIIVDNNSHDMTKQMVNELLSENLSFSNKIKFIQLDKTNTLDVSMNIALSHATNDWVLRFDADFIACDNFNDLIQLVNNENNFDGIFLYAINIYGDWYHINAKRKYKIYNLFLIKKSFVNYQSFTGPTGSISYKISYQNSNGSSGKYKYLNNPDKDPCYIWSMGDCKSTHKILYNIFKYQYWSWIASVNTNTNTNENIDFDYYYEEILNKNYASTIRWLEKNLGKDKEIMLHNLVLPSKLQLSRPKFILKGDAETFFYREYILDADQLYDYEITLVILVRNTQCYLKQCLESIFKQTSTKWKIILINDASYNPLILNDYISNEYVRFRRNIKFYDLDQWNGLIKCHKLAVMNVETDIVGIVDSDDMLEPDAVESVLKIYNSTEEEIFVYSNFWYCSSSSENDAMYKVSQGFSYHVKTSLLNDRRANHFRTFKIKHYFMTSGYDEDLLFGSEDQDILIQLEQFAKPYYLHKYLYLYRSINITNSISSMKTLSVYSMVLSIIKNIIRRYGFFEPELVIYCDINHDEKHKYLHSRSYESYGESKIIIDNVKYYFEIHSNGIYIMSIMPVDFERNKDFILSKLSETKSIKCKMTWTNENYWKLLESSGEKLDSIYQMELAIFRPNQYFGQIYVIVNDINANLDMNANINLSYIKVNNLIIAIQDAIINQYKKILVIKDLKKFNINNIEFNKYIRSIPYDWNLLYFDNNNDVIGYDKLIYDDVLNNRLDLNAIHCLHYSRVE